jgi:hypothetical protein
MKYQKSLLIKTIGERHTGTTAIAASVRIHPATTTRIPDREMQQKFKAASEKMRHLNETSAGIDRLTCEINHHEALLPFPNVLAWKHGVPAQDDYDNLWNVHYIIAIRHPYSWILSFARIPYHMMNKRERSFSSFIRREWLCSPRDGLGEKVADPLTLWQKKYEAFAEFSNLLGPRAAFLRHEDLIQNGARSLQAIYQKWNLDTETVVLPKQSTKDERENLKSIKARLDANVWRKLLCRGDVAFINSRIDWNFASRFGYEPSNPAEFPRLLSFRALRARYQIMRGKEWKDIFAGLA